MLATLGGSLALVAGLAVMLLPLLALELSRPRDSAWGALILLLGLVLVTSVDRLTGSPMLAVLCGGLLIGRLGLEVGQSRWRQLSPEERQRLWSPERWRQVLEQLITSIARLVGILTGAASALLTWAGARRRSGSGKLWVRPELPGVSPDTQDAQDTTETPDTTAAGTDTPTQTDPTVRTEPAPAEPDEAVQGEAVQEEAGETLAAAAGQPAQGEEEAQAGREGDPEEKVREVRDFTEVDALLRQSSPPGAVGADELRPDEQESDDASAPRDGTG